MLLTGKQASTSGASNGICTALGEYLSAHQGDQPPSTRALSPGAVPAWHCAVAGSLSRLQEP